MRRQLHLFIIHHAATLRQGAGVFLTLFLLLAPACAFADDTILHRFTNSMTTVYVSSTECAGTLAPGPDEYIKLITGYLNVLYNGNGAYWALPQVTERITDKGSCITALQEYLADYQAASHDYRDNYPEQPAPPVLLAYNWNNGRYIPPPAASPPSAPPVYTQPPATETRTVPSE